MPSPRMTEVGHSRERPFCRVAPHPAVGLEGNLDILSGGKCLPRSLAHDLVALHDHQEKGGTQVENTVPEPGSGSLCQ